MYSELSQSLLGRMFGLGCRKSASHKLPKEPTKVPANVQDAKIRKTDFTVAYSQTVEIPK